MGRGLWRLPFHSGTFLHNPQSMRLLTLCRRQGPTWGAKNRTHYQQLVLMTQGGHPFPSRTRKLSPVVPKILGWRRPGKIGRCQHRIMSSISMLTFCRRKGPTWGAKNRTHYQQLVLMTQGVHPFPSRTRKLSPVVPKILGWRRPGKIGRCQHLIMSSISMLTLSDNEILFYYTALCFIKAVYFLFGIILAYYDA